MHNTGFLQPLTAIVLPMLVASIFVVVLIQPDPPEVSPRNTTIPVAATNVTASSPESTTNRDAVTLPQGARVTTVTPAEETKAAVGTDPPGAEPVAGTPAAPVTTVAAAAPAPELEVARVAAGAYDKSCSRCHDEGTDGAPKLGDQSAWIDATAQGVDTLVTRLSGAAGAHDEIGKLSRDELDESIQYIMQETFWPTAR